jgi:hypothetical protein
LATYRAIAAVGKTLVNALKDASVGTEFAGLRFELFQAGDFKGGNPMQEGITLYLYRLAVNGSRRSMPPSVGPDGQRFRSPIPVDLYYMLTPWARDVEKQHRLLGWAVREMQNMPVLLASLLNNYVPESNTFRAVETIEVILETVSLQDMTNILERLDINQQLSVCYVARTVLLESTLPLDEGPPVQTRAYDYGKVTG